MRIVSVGGRLVMASVVGVWILGSASSVGAQATRAEPRLALVIGNSAYRESPLRNPVNDVRAMAQRFRELGFTVLAHENATKRTMEAAIIEFGRRLAEGGVGAFYYAGHGLQVRGRNYLVPVDAEIDDEASTRVAAVDVEFLLEQMAEAKNRVNMVILDACRNNPFERLTDLIESAQGRSALARRPSLLSTYLRILRKTEKALPHCRTVGTLDDPSLAHLPREPQVRKFQFFRLSGTVFAAQFNWHNAVLESVVGSDRRVAETRLKCSRGPFKNPPHRASGAAA